MKKYVKSATTKIWEEPIDVQLEFAKTSDNMDMLRQLADNGRAVVKYEVAENPNITEDIIRLLYDDGKGGVGYLLATNPNTPTDILDDIYDKDSGYRTAKAIAKNPNTSAQTLSILGMNDSYVVRYYTAANPNTPTSTLQELAHDIESTVRSKARESLRHRG